MSKLHAAGRPYVGYDSGGWLMPGDVPVSGLRKPEAILTPDQWDILRTVAGQAVSHAAGQGRQVVVQQHFHGTQWPNSEQKAAMQRELGLALAGA